MSDIDIDKLKKEALNFYEFQKTSIYEDLLKMLEIDFKDTPKPNLIFSIYAWYMQDILEIPLPETTIEKFKVPEENVSVTSYTMDEYKEKFNYILEQDAARELEIEHKEKENEIQII